MSADLFAEFSNPPPSSTNPQPSSPYEVERKPQAQDLARVKNTFSFTTAQGANSTSQQTPAWSSFQSSSNSMSGWGQSFHQSQPAASAPKPADNDEDDDEAWGDFEEAEPSMPSVAFPPASFQAHAPVSTTPGSSARSFTSGPQLSSAKGVSANGLLGLDSAIGQLAQEPVPQSSFGESKRKIVVKSTPSDPNVLFDADDFELQDGVEGDEDLDDFGDFEVVKPQLNGTAGPPGASSAFDLLSLDDPPVQPRQESVMMGASRAFESSLRWEGLPTETKPQSVPQAPSRPSVVTNSKRTTAMTSISSRAPIEDNEWAVWGSSSTEAKPQVITPTPSQPGVTNAKKQLVTTSVPFQVPVDDDEWTAWDDVPAGNAGSGAPLTSKEPDVSNVSGQGWQWDAEEVSVKADDDSPPPTNVPPPAILLSSFSELFSSGDVLFKALSGQTTNTKQQILSSSKTVTFLQGYILIATTAARIIAGRKHRWHRDKILAKSMSISAAGSKGMKLAGLDKTQSAREDREAADVIVAWKEYVGRLRSAVAAANSTGKANLKVPELAESPQIQTAKMVPTAAKPCVICGLKREERVVRVDFDVEDSFGEWWVEYWGHRACKNFWLQHEEKLRQR
ncbi:hypothetical protein E4U17_006111 [Claviceps sp. LM77 group G4]|nr:hypothetical protein E4U17_006111 [Claviceps sp. LM77 group G4]KAG6068574.1 hypothetical protein E4U33_005027 [Claviceps sp. LM78 group G4]KAG6079547.1 hypothetical protein E4U16_000977 [Claviceps sp. LM84 group G4]